MAQGVFRHRPIIARPSWSWHQVAASTQARWDRISRLARQDPRLFLWSALWLPFWLVSDAPAPDLPARRTRMERRAFSDPAGIYLADRVDHTVTAFGRTWLAGSLLRGVTLALLVLTAWALLAVVGLVSLPGWGPVIAVFAFGLVAGAVYARLIWPDRLMVATMLDHTFELRERIVSAFDRPDDTGHVSRLQLADAANTYDEIMHDIPRSTFVPVREGAICLIVAGALVTMLLAYVPHHGIAAVADSPVPQFVPASERLAVQENPVPQQQPPDQPTQQGASIAEIQERGRESQSTRDDLAQLGDALDGHAITQPAADAIANGEYASAADSLRSASKAASSMSEAERNALADDLDAAAQQISESNPELAQAANDAADALREGGPEAEQALSDLADQVDQSGEKVQSPDQTAQDLDEAQSGSTDPNSEGNQDQGENQGQSQGSDQQPQESQEGSSDPGEGSAAKPGVSNQEQQPSDTNPGDSSSGSTDDGSGSSDTPPQDGQQPGDSSQEGSGEGEPTDQQGSSDGEPSNQNSMEGAPNEESSSSQGSGAGTGQTGANDQNTSEEAVDSPQDPSEITPEPETPSNGEAGEPPPSRSDRGEEDDSRGTDSESATSLELEGTSDEGIDTGGDSGSSSLGSGDGTSTANGDQTQTEVGVAGPDSNRAPDDLRDVIKGYFEGPEP